MPEQPDPPNSAVGLGPIAGVIVWTAPDRFPAMRDFYRDTLGLPPRSVKDDFISFWWPEPGATITGAEPRLNIAAHRDIAGPSADPLRIMVNFTVTDIAATHRRLIAAGVAFTRPPEQEKWGGVVATFADPDGNTLQLFQLPA